MRNTPLAENSPDVIPARSGETAAEVCIEVVRVFPTVDIAKRSPTLDGTIPMRAAQSCKPFLDGNSAGLHLRFAELAMIEKTDDGPLLRMGDEAFAAATADYEEKIENLVHDGLVRRNGYWHSELLKGFAVTEDGRIRVWTGLLVRPIPEICILVSRSMNRACPVGVREYVIPAGTDFIPLFLELDAVSLRDRETWLDVEIACLTPLQPGAAIHLRPLSERPDTGQSFADFYSDRYFDSKSAGQNSGQYRNIVAKTLREAAVASGDCEIVYASPQSANRVRYFDRFASEQGFSENHPQQASLPWAEIDCLGHITANFDGRAPRAMSVDLAGKDEQLRTEWSGMYGESALGAIEQWIAYVHANQGPVTEPYLVIQPWILSTTPQGWSILLESYDLPGIQGMLGVLGSDSYHGVLPLWLVERLGEFDIAAGTPLLRIIPVPRRLLKAGFRELPLRPTSAPVQ